MKKTFQNYWKFFFLLLFVSSYGMLWGQCDFTISIDQDNSDLTTSCGASDGSVTFILKGLKGASYTREWKYGNFSSGGTTKRTDTTHTRTGLDAGVYELIINPDSCSAKSLTVTIMEGGLAVTDFSVTPPPSCDANSKGEIDIKVSNPAITGTVNGDSINFDVNGEYNTEALPGPYQVTLNDPQNACMFDTMFTISAGGFSLKIEGTIDSPCGMLDNGMVMLLASGGNIGSTSKIYKLYRNGNSVPYKEIRIPGNELTIDSLEAGDYRATVELLNNNDGCIGENTFSIEKETPYFRISATSGEMATCGNSDGSASVAFTGGKNDTLMYTYTWDNDEMAAEAIMLSEGLHTVTVADENKCEVTTTVTVNGEIGFTASVSQVQAIPCEAGGKGQLEVTITGGSGDFSYEWEDGQNGTTAEFEEAGSYIVTVSQGECDINVEGTLNYENPPSLETILPTSFEFISGSEGSISLEYNVPVDDLEFEVVNSNNIDANASSYMSSGTTGNPFKQTYVLLNNQVSGSVNVLIRGVAGNCKSNPTSLNIQVSPKPLPPVPESIFSPNGDGINDEWMINFNGNSSESYAVRVFSRNGHEVFNVKGYTAPWDGTACPVGAYYYVIVDTRTDEKFTGAVSILR